VNWYLHGSKLLKPFYPSLTWDIKTDDKVVYLTFDDGPTPEVTDYVLNILDEFGFTATFFCIGENVVKHPNTYQKISDANHQVGNHTFNHLNGFQTSSKQYDENVKQAATCISSNLFRPPFGRIKRSQINLLKDDYNIVMWTAISGDFDTNLDRSWAYKRLIQLTKPGAIIVFHDSIKAYDNLKALLPKYCTYLKENGFTSCRL
jgi:peptidoglycan-N-acetylglucosamine deacetylase